MVDTHCHLDSCKPPDAELVARARDAGVNRIATVGMNDTSIERAISAAREHDDVVAIVGRHPNEAAGFEAADIEPIEQAARDERVRAIGETGLDYYRDYAPRDDQLRAFEAHVDLARRLDLPLVIHTRAAEEDTFAVLRDRAEGLTVILHCFSAPGRLDECVERGWLCSFAGNVTYPKATDLHARRARRAGGAAARGDRLAVPRAAAGARQAQRARERRAHGGARGVLRGVPYEELDATVERNAARVFGW